MSCEGRHQRTHRLAPPWPCRWESQSLWTETPQTCRRERRTSARSPGRPLKGRAEGGEAPRTGEAPEEAGGSSASLGEDLSTLTIKYTSPKSPGSTSETLTGVVVSDGGFQKPFAVFCIPGTHDFETRTVSVPAGQEGPRLLSPAPQRPGSSPGGEGDCSATRRRLHYHAAKHWECCAATPADAPLGPRKTMGTG